MKIISVWATVLLILLLFNWMLMSDQVPVYTKSQLALRNGTDREEIWCAYKGKIYELNRSRLWRGGKHYEHWAGQDLTAEMKDAPHLETVFDKFEVVGILKEN